MKTDLSLERREKQSPFVVRRAYANRIDETQFTRFAINLHSYDTSTVAFYAEMVNEGILSAFPLHL